MDKNINKLIYSNPQNAIEITQLLLNQPGLKEKEKAKLIFQIARAYKVKGDFSRSLLYLYQSDNYKSQLSDFDFKLIEIGKADILIELSFYNEANKIIDAVGKTILEGKTDDSTLFFGALLNIERGKILFKQNKYKEAIKLIKPSTEKLGNKFLELEIWYNISLGKCYLGIHDIAVSKSYFEKALEIINNNDKGNGYAKTYIFCGLAEVAFKQKDYDNAIKLLNQSYNYAVDLNNIFLQEKAINLLNQNYLAKNDIENYKISTAKLTEFSGGIYILNQEAVNTVFNLISTEQENKYSQEESVYYSIEYVLWSILLLLLLFFAAMWWRIYQKKTRLQEVINYLEITRNNFLDKIPFKSEKPKKSLIPKETEDLILNKLKKFETTKKFTNKDISLAVLAGQFDTNTKYLSEVINTHYEINFNTYINKLRVNYIVEKIKADPNFKNYKISYLADFCGFSSHSSFATVFKSITGLSPITFIDLIKKEKENSIQND